MKLTEMKCIDPQPTDSPLENTQVKRYVEEIDSWNLEDKAIKKDFSFKSFPEAIAFVQDLAKIADEQNHHPDILISFKKVKLTLTTHKIGGLSLNDFIVAAKIDQLFFFQINQKENSPDNWRGQKDRQDHCHNSRQEWN